MKVELEVLLKEASNAYKMLELDLQSQLEAEEDLEMMKFERESLWFKAIIEGEFEGLKNEDQRNAHFIELHPDSALKQFRAEQTLKTRRICVQLTESRIEYLRYQLRVWEIQSKLWSLPTEQDETLKRLIATEEKADTVDDLPF